MDSSVQFSHSVVQIFQTPWTAVCQVSMSIINSQSLLKLMPIESVMPPSHHMVYVSFSSCLQSFPASGTFQMSQLFASGGQSIGASITMKKALSSWNFYILRSWLRSSPGSFRPTPHPWSRPPPRLCAAVTCLLLLPHIRGLSMVLL